MRVPLLGALLLAAGCRIETASPQGAGPASAPELAEGDVWVYTSMYRQVIDAIDPQLKAELPQVQVHWFQAGSEKVMSRLEAELAAGATQADVLMTSDPFLYQRYKAEDRWLRYVSPNGLRTPASLVDLDGHYAAVRLSTMVLVHRKEVADPPTSFEALADPRFKGEVALGDPLTSGTAFTWAVFCEQRLGTLFFQRLRDNQARVAGGNAAVLQKLEGGEAKVGVLLLENALAAIGRGSPIEITWPTDGAVLIPGDVAIFKTSRHPAAAKAVVDWLLSPRGQALMVQPGDMHAVDPRLGGPRGQPGLAELLPRSQPWTEALLSRGNTEGARIKSDFSAAFSK